jgi:uncharacterized protein YqjF (DUF2071 family)
MTRPFFVPMEGARLRDAGAERPRETTYRSWPIPDRPWVMSQRWDDLLFMHWPLAPDALRTLVPAELELDVHDAAVWVTITPFYLGSLRPRGIPLLPFVSEFAELNVRTYVRVDDKPGVYFFSLDAGSTLAVIGARTTFHLPYFRAAMTVRRDADGSIQYESRRVQAGEPARFSATYSPTGAAARSAPGSLDHWLTERYCLYTLDAERTVYRVEINHAPWSLQPARVEIRHNTVASAAGIALPDEPPRVAFSKRLDVLVWDKERVR